MKTQLILGWFAVVLSVCAAVAVIVVSVVGDGSGIIIKVIWLPFTLLWGVKQIRQNKIDNTNNAEVKNDTTK